MSGDPGVRRLYTTREVAELLRVKPRTVERWRWLDRDGDAAVGLDQLCREGGRHGPPYLRIGVRTIRYDAADVAAFLERYRPRVAKPKGPDPRQLEIARLIAVDTHRRTGAPS